MNDKLKRERSANWDSNEKMLLTELIKPYFEILDNKSLFCSVNEAKANAWNDITKKYNSICINRKKSMKQLKIKWKKLKNVMKKQMMTKENSTKGISLTQSSESQGTVDNGQLQCFKVESIEFDSDSNETEDPLDESELMTENVMVTSAHKENSKTQVDFEIVNHFKEATTQTCDFKSTNNHKNGNSVNFSEAFHEDMRYYRDMENNRLEKEHLLRVRTMKEQHNQVMKNLQLQEEILKRQLKKLD